MPCRPQLMENWVLAAGRWAGVAAVPVVPRRRLRACWDMIDLVGLLDGSSARMSASSTQGGPRPQLPSELPVPSAARPPWER